jgi:hypothetical protein
VSGRIYDRGYKILTKYERATGKERRLPSQMGEEANLNMWGH